MGHTTEQPETPEEPAVWERPLPWLQETESESGPEAETASESASESASEAGSASEAAVAPGGPTSAPQGESASDRTSTPTPTPAPEPVAEAAPDGGPGRLFRSPDVRPDTPGTRDEAGSGQPRPERGARVVGAVVAACALLVLGLGSAAFMALPNDDDPAPRAAAVGDGTVPQLAEGGSAGLTGSPSATGQGSGRPPHDPKGTKPGTAKGAHTTTDSSSAADSAAPDKAADGTKAAHAASTGGSGGTGTTGDKATSKPASKPAATHAASSTTAAGDTIVGYASSKCVEVSAHAGTDGSPLRLWGCDGDAWQKWVFRSDGSVRSMGLCLDIADASQGNGATVQLATCNGGWAQKFNLNSSHDLVNTVIGKCVDAKDAGTGNGTRLQLWDCTGASNQKWHLG
ncbi:ricin-type beta-trefoil lectin domain protein [Streptomyces sp. NPDC048278]|uniref:ricin-type beta-trefoil lectin domain protein n=1 Tax=Streptomyces sp. NPDC048278 TaxID=3155809 RepID=UPI003447A73F